jgi:hypothetical protein
VLLGGTIVSLILARDTLIWRIVVNHHEFVVNRESAVQVASPARR